MLKRIMVAALSAAFIAGTCASPAIAQAAKKTPAKEQTAPADEPAAKQPSAKQKAARERMKHCGEEWQAMKKDGKTKGQTWAQFSAQCLKKKS